MARFLLLFLLLASLPDTGTLPAWSQEGSLELYQDDDSGLTPELLRVRTLIRANVLGLAESILETQGPPILPTSQWLSWERQLWSLYASRDKWQVLFQRTRQVPPSFPPFIRREAGLVAVTALVELQQGLRARQILRGQLLAMESTELAKRKLRKLLVESYLADDLLGDAGIAMQRYQMDYRSQEEDWLFLSARVYMQLGDLDNAINLLAPLDKPRARLLGIYARLKNGSMTTQQALQRTTSLSGPDNDYANRKAVRPYEVLAVEAFASRAGDLNGDYLDRLEQYLSIVNSTETVLDSAFPRYDAGDLLLGYTVYARDIANQAGLLQGEDSRWFDYAIQLPPGQVAQKKAIYGYLLQHVTDPIFRLQISNFFVNTLVQSGNMAVIAVLYGENLPFGELSLSGNVGLELSNIAIEQGNIQLAALVNGSLSEVPQGMDSRQWLIHVARVSIIAGQYKQGTDELMKWIQSFENMQPGEIDQALQPVFDLQKVDQHLHALQLLEELWPRITTQKHEREVAYWIAESYQATRQYVRAADYFLYSAMLKDSGLDQWGASARFKAAESLQSANLYADSRVLIENLLRRASDENRQAQLQQRLQELWLLQSSMETGTDSR